MPTKKQSDWLQSQGGRTVKDNKGANMGEEKPSLADKLMKKKEEAIELQMTAQALGGGNVEADESETLKLAKEVMQIQRETVKSVDDARKRTEEALAKAETAKNEAQTALYTHQLDAIKDAEARVKVASEAKPTPGKSELEIFRKVRDEMQELMPEKPEAATPPGISEATQLKITQLQLEQQRVLAQMQADRERQNREFDLKLAEFNENSRQRWAEYNDNKALREQGLSGLQDIAASIGAAVKGESGGVEETEGEHVEASISSFPCQFCQTPVPVHPGDTKVKCPNEECGAQYDIKAK